VIGSSLSGLRAAEQLRAQGYDDELVLVGAEPHLPYDRPPLSKDYLRGAVGPADLALAEQSEIDELEARWHLGIAAERLDPTGGRIILSSGADLTADAVVIASGGVPRRMPAADGLGGVHVLRTIEHADALRDDLAGGAERVAVIGAGFIGAEVAATCRALGLEVTIVEAMPVPLSAALGPKLGAVCAGMHATNGVALVTATTVVEWLTAPDGPGRRRVTGRYFATVGDCAPMSSLSGSACSLPPRGWPDPAFPSTTVCSPMPDMSPTGRTSSPSAMSPGRGTPAWAGMCAGSIGRMRPKVRRSRCGTSSPGAPCSMSTSRATSGPTSTAHGSSSPARPNCPTRSGSSMVLRPTEPLSRPITGVRLRPRYWR
jgi:hypothetical protein